MTRLDLIGYGITLYFLLTRPKTKVPTANVDLGIPTVVGSGSEALDNQGYFSVHEDSADLM